jgi:hypothetical protein
MTKTGKIQEDLQKKIFNGWLKTPRQKDRESQRQKDRKTERQTHKKTKNQKDRKAKRHKDRKTERQKDRKTERQNDRKTERQKDKKTERRMAESFKYPFVLRLICHSNFNSSFKLQKNTEKHWKMLKNT